MKINNKNLLRNLIVAANYRLGSDKVYEVIETVESIDLQENKVPHFILTLNAHTNKEVNTIQKYAIPIPTRFTTKQKESFFERVREKFINDLWCLSLISVEEMSKQSKLLVKEEKEKESIKRKTTKKAKITTE